MPDTANQMENSTQVNSKGKIGHDGVAKINLPSNQFKKPMKKFKVEGLKEREEDIQHIFIEGYNYYNGTGRPQNYTKALEHFLKVCEMSHAGATSMIGYMYEKGRGVPKDYSEALKYYLKASGMGHAIATFNVGVMYENGRGVPKDYP